MERLHSEKALVSGMRAIVIYMLMFNALFFMTYVCKDRVSDFVKLLHEIWEGGGGDKGEQIEIGRAHV